MPHAFFVHSRALFRVIPSFGEESRVWMLRFAQHDRLKCHSERSEESSAMWMLHYADAPFSMTEVGIEN